MRFHESRVKPHRRLRTRRRELQRLIRLEARALEGAAPLSVFVAVDRHADECRELVRR